VAYPIAGWSNWATFHDVCRECGRRVTGFVCDSGRLTRLGAGRWTVEMQWQHDGDGTVECDLAPSERGRWPRSDRVGRGPDRVTPSGPDAG
jgi:hypothetical protein